MASEREQEIQNALQAIVDGFTATEDEPELTMFGLISRYNATEANTELIGGDWAAARGINPEGGN